jgi:gluconate 2-dehydrogenase gamma chain
MQQINYPSGTVRALLQTDLVLPQTKEVLQQRLSQPPVTKPRFFSSSAFEILKAVCNRLIPQTEHAPIDLAGLLDASLAQNRGNGWRYNAMPPDQESFRLGIDGIEEAAQVLNGSCFIALSAAEQDEVLLAVQNGNVAGKAWQNQPSNLFFVELLSRLVEHYYGHPLAKESIGEVAFADAKGWQHIQLNEHEPQEPLPLHQS